MKAIRIIMILILLFGLGCLAFSQQNIYVAGIAEYVVPMKIESGISVGADFNNKWNYAFAFQYGLQGYTYTGIEACRSFRGKRPYRYIGFGLKAGAFDAYYLCFRPFVRATYILNEDFTFRCDLMLRAFMPDIAIQLAYNFIKPVKHPLSY